MCVLYKVLWFNFYFYKFFLVDFSIDEGRELIRDLGFMFEWVVFF